MAMDPGVLEMRWLNIQRWRPKDTEMQIEVLQCTQTEEARRDAL